MSGVRDYLVLAGLAGRGDADLLTQAQALALIRRQRALGFAPGTRFDYSNSNYVLLAEIVKRVSGKILREFMRERIFAPLGMTATRLHDDLGLIEPGSATGYRRREGGGWARAVYNHETVGSGGRRCGRAGSSPPPSNAGSRKTDPISCKSTSRRPTFHCWAGQARAPSAKPWSSWLG
jgi:CubicO group peptidase (beta-lactamase class C family)